MGRFILDRRTVLRGIGGATVALPPLEIMMRGTARAAGDEQPKRFLIAYGGIAIGATYPVAQNETIPKDRGASYTLTRGLAPLDGGPGWQVGGESYASVRDDAGIITGLYMPYDKAPGSPGGTLSAFHGGFTHWCQMSGIRV